MFSEPCDKEKLKARGKRGNHFFCGVEDSFQRRKEKLQGYVWVDHMKIRKNSGIENSHTSTRKCLSTKPHKEQTYGNV